MGNEDETETGNAGGGRKRGRTPEEIAAVTGSDPEDIRMAYEAIRIVDEDGNPIDEDGNPIQGSASEERES